MNTHSRRPSEPPDTNASNPAHELLEDLTGMIKTTLPMAPGNLTPFTALMNPRWVLKASSRLVQQFNELTMACEGRPRSEDGTGIISDEPKALTRIAMAHAWLVALAQRSAVDVCQDLMIGLPRPMMTSHVTEINGVALFAGCIDRNGCSARLSTALQHVARRTLELCDARGVRAQFIFGKTIKGVSPMTKQSTIPFTACRVRAEGMNTTDLLAILQEAILSAGGETNKPTGELLVMSNLWLE